MKKLLRALLLLLFLLLCAMAAFHHFVTLRVTDWGGMENPELPIIEETLTQ